MTTTTDRFVPILDLGPEIEALWDELNTQFQSVLRSGQFIGGEMVERFEHEVAAYLGVKHAVGVNSGTDALVIALRAVGVGPGDEVITTPFSFFATAESISNVGARPIFVDIEEGSFNIDTRLIENAITTRTRAILPVHLYGRPADMDAIMGIARAHRLKVIEDCAQSFGARHNDTEHTGTIGDVGTYSFFPSKNLGAFGDGGLLVTNDEDTAAHARKLRSHGSVQKYRNEILGYNSRLDSLQAAFLRVKLPHVDSWNQGRREAAKRYNQLLENVDSVVTPEVSPGHVFHQYTIRLLGVDRSLVQQHLKEAGVGTMVYYPVPQDKLPVYAGMGSNCPVSDRLADEVLSLPIGPSLTPQVSQFVASALSQTLRQ